MSTKPAEVEDIGFSEAMSELNRIVAELESDDLEVDLLAERVERAAFLVDWCRTRLDSTRMQVEEIVLRLDGPSPDEE